MMRPRAIAQHNISHLPVCRYYPAVLCVLEGRAIVLLFACHCTNRSTQINSGFYKGFNDLLAQEIANIGTENIRFLSPAICPDCASGANADNMISQQQLYERMDLMCSAGITDFSVFTFFEVVQRRANRRLGGTLAERYFRAFEYFRTGTKPITP